jgi:short subunit dehydrogenase-like uncharacterized protein
MEKIMITLFGATGYTGKLIANALSREGLSFRLAGRSAEKLAHLSSSLPGQPDWLVADAAKPSTLPPLFHDTNLLINCASPFTDLGEPVLSRAALCGVNYIDITNELGFVFRARSYHEMAVRNGAALVSACAFEVALADCAASILAGQMMVDPDEPEPLDQIHVVYSLGGSGASKGTRRSAVRSLATSWVAYRDGDWVGQIPGGKVRRFCLPGRERHALSFPSSETVTIPAHIPLRRVDTWMSTTSGARFWAPVAIPLFARMARSILRGLILNVVARNENTAIQALDIGIRDDAPFIVYVSAHRGKESRWIALTGKNPYGITADIVAYSARQLSRSDYEKSGLLAPAQALEPRPFINYAVKHWDITMHQGEKVD